MPAQRETRALEIDMALPGQWCMIGSFAARRRGARASATRSASYDIFDDLRAATVREARPREAARASSGEAAVYVL